MLTILKYIMVQLMANQLKAMPMILNIGFQKYQILIQK